MVRQVGGAGVRRRPVQRKGRDVLDHDAIIDAALTVVAQDGRDALSVAAVARRLDVSPRAIYHYVASRGELVSAMTERVQRHLPMPRATGQWRDDLTRYRDDLLVYLRDHGAVLELTEIEGVYALSERYHEVVENALEIFVSIGLDPRTAMLAYAEFARWIGAAHRYLDLDDATPDDLFDRVVRSGHDASIAAPTSRPLTRDAGTVTSREQLDFGFELLLTSFQALAERPG